jgi:NAD(P)-dependent dehydrogenase (short-subunit alcohol dehydrogenase family)
MKTIVITGGTRGIGRGLAESFLKRGCRVAVCGRSGESVAKAVAELAKTHGHDVVTGMACDVGSHHDLEALWDHAVASFGRVDVWINNAGRGLGRKPLVEAGADEIGELVRTNVTGMLLACKVAIRGMTGQGGGQVWNMEGFGSRGEVMSGMTGYGATKRAVGYINKSLIRETKGGPVQVCALSPGMVVTDLLVGDIDRDSKQWQKTKRIFNILADRVETVTPWLADMILATDRTGARVAWLTPSKVLWRFIAAAFRKRDLFPETDEKAGR